MIKKLKHIILSAAAFAALTAPALVAAPASAQYNLDTSSKEISSGLCSGVQLDAATSGDCNSANLKSDSDTQLSSLIKLVINVFSLIVGFVAVIMIIIGGFRYITSGGASDSITSAKNTIIYAVIGLVIVALAQFIVRFVLGRVSGAQ